MALFWNDLTGDLRTDFCVVDDVDEDGNAESRPVAGWVIFNMDCNSSRPDFGDRYGVGTIPEVICPCCFCCEDNVDDTVSLLYCNSGRPNIN